MGVRRGIFLADVVANVPLCREHCRLVLRVNGFPESWPGQFVQIACHDVGWADEAVEREMEWADGMMPQARGRDFCEPVAMLRRPFSIGGRRDVGGVAELDIIHRVVGVGTDWLSGLKVGDKVDIAGPLGNRFLFPDAGKTALLVGGGVGIPPMIYLAQELARAGRGAVAFAGATTRELLALQITGESSVDATGRLNVEEFARVGVPTVVATDDGSFGFRGFVTQALETYLDARGEVGAVVYTCGPEGMMRRVADIAARRGLECQIAVERAMACGMGTCQSCVIRVKQTADDATGVFRLACTDGPVFERRRLVW